MDFRGAGGKLATMSASQNASSFTAFILIILTAIYWGAACFVAIALFWVICSPAMTPDCPTLADSAIRATGVLLTARCVFGMAVLAIRALFHWK
ncbi:MAG: hypothetical protein AB7H66_08925 [Hyphomonadaceae bacterium]